MFNRASMEVGPTNDSEEILEFIDTVVGRTTNRLCYGGACAARDCVFGYIYFRQPCLGMFPSVQ